MRTASGPPAARARRPSSIQALRGVRVGGHLLVFNYTLPYGLEAHECDHRRTDRRIAVGALIGLTLFHFTDNFVNVEDTARGLAVGDVHPGRRPVIFWLVFAAFGVIGYRY